jgi:type IV secretion system protein TrbL
VLAALALLGLGIFGPGIANGIVSGGPQLGAGAAIGTGLAAGGVVVAGAGLAAASAGALAGAARGTAALAANASVAFRVGGLSGVKDAAASAMSSPLRRAATSSGSSSTSTGDAAAGEAGAAQAPANSSSADLQSRWASRMQRMQTIRHGASAATNAVRSADRNGGGASVDLSEGKQ